jgi:endonuclease/exonuclease/phosphatase family metal-dependent hydrolase
MNLKVLSYNAWQTPAVITADLHLRARHLPEALAQANADVIALQEMWNPELRNRLIRQMQPHGYAHAAFVEGRRGWVRGYFGNGLLILSRYPLVGEPELQEFSGYTYFEEFFVRKGALRVTLQLPTGEQVDVVNTHLGAVRFDGRRAARMHADDQAHLAQVRELAAFIKTGTRPTLIAADFNAHFETENYAWWCRELGLSEATATVRSAGGPIYTFDRRNPYIAQSRFGQVPSEFVDYVWTRGPGWQAQKAELALHANHPQTGKPLSDHYGVVAELAFRPQIH